jgi:hypothetical protein
VIVTSCRKFDRFGDWHWFTFILQAREMRRCMRNESPEFKDRYFYEFNDASGDRAPAAAGPAPRARGARRSRRTGPAA